MKRKKSKKFGASMHGLFGENVEFVLVYIRNSCHQVLQLGKTIRKKAKECTLARIYKNAHFKVPYSRLEAGNQQTKLYLLTCGMTEECKNREQNPRL